MKKFGSAYTLVGFAVLVSSPAFASLDSIKAMKSGSPVSINGTVESIKNEREFTLRDKTGTINVDIESNQSVVLKPGDSVSVDGTLDKNILGADINATTVTVNKNVAQAASDAIEGRTNLSFEGATAYNINNLPKEGLVKIFGTVTDVDNEKKFTLKDSTGSINVQVESAETAALTEGAKVTVIGYVDSGLLGRDINAHKVLVVTDTTSSRP